MGAPAALALLLLATLLAAAPHVASHAQDAEGEAGEGGAAGAPAGAEPIDVWVAIGLVLAVAAVSGTVWNGWQLRVHVSLLKKDGDERLRPVLGWTKFGDTMSGPLPAYWRGGEIRVKIVNAGQVAAMGVTSRTRYGPASDFEGARIRETREEWGTIAPNKYTEIRVRVTEEEESAARGDGIEFRLEVDFEYRAPDGREYRYCMGGVFDGTGARFYDRDAGGGAGAPPARPAPPRRRRRRRA